MPAPMPALTIQRATENAGWLSAGFRYNKAMVQVFQRLPKRKFVPDGKVWEFEPSFVAVQALQGTGATIAVDPAARELWERAGGVYKEGTPENQTVVFDLSDCGAVGSKAEREPLPEGFKFVTLPFIKQREALEYINGNPKFYLNMEVGTGKSKVYIDSARLHGYKLRRAVAMLWVGPNNKVPDYRRELFTHADGNHGNYGALKTRGDNFEFFDGRGGAQKWERALKRCRAAMAHNINTPGYLCVIGLNWESLERRTEHLPDGFFDVLALDEAHCAKSPTSGQGKGAKALALGTACVLLGSGTPCPQGPLDLWNQISMLAPHMLPSDFISHRKRYAITELVELPGSKDGSGKPRKFLQVVGYQNLLELRDIFMRVSFTAFQKDCFDLPAPIPERRYIEMDDATRKCYEDVRKEGVFIADPNHVCLADSAGVVLLRAQQVCGGFIGLTDDKGRADGRSMSVPGRNKKLEYVVGELIPELLASREGRQVVVWAFGRGELRALSDALAAATFTDPTGSARPIRVATLWGDTPKAERETLDADFRAGKFDVLVSNPQSGGTGMEFQTADAEIWYSRSFNLLYRQQGEGRLLRYGQKRQVLRIDVLYEDTLEDYVLDVLESKRQLQDLLTSNPRQVLTQAFSEAL